MGSHPVKVVGPEPEPCELYFHEQALEISDRNRCLVKNEPPSITSTPKKKVTTQSEENIYPLHTPKSESRSTAKLTNMFVEDLPQGDQMAQTNFSDPSAVNIFSMRFTKSAVATDYHLYVPNNRQANNNNPVRGQLGRGRAPNRGRVNPRQNANRGGLGRVVVGRGQPRGGPGGPAANLRVRAPPPNPGNLNPPNPNPNPLIQTQIHQTQIQEDQEVLVAPEDQGDLVARAHPAPMAHQQDNLTQLLSIF